MIQGLLIGFLLVIFGLSSLQVLSMASVNIAKSFKSQDNQLVEIAPKSLILSLELVILYFYWKNYSEIDVFRFWVCSCLGSD